MKKRNGIFILILLILLMVFAFLSSGFGKSYIQNYGYNFRVNLEAVMKTLHLPIPDFLQSFFDEAKPKEPQTEYELLMLEIEKEAAEQELQAAEEQALADKQTALDNAEYNKTIIKHTGTNIALSNAAAARYARYSNGILCATETQLSFYDTKAVKKWSEGIQISSPIMKVSGKYILLFEKSGKKFTVYNGQKPVYTSSVDGKIKTASISEKGDAVIVFNRDSYKGSVAVFNKSGEQVYLWNSGTYNIMDADISDSRRLAVALLDSSSQITSKIYFFDIDKPEAEASTDIADSLVFDIDFNGKTLNAFADNRTIGLSQNGKINWSYDTSEKNIINYAMADNGAKAIAYDNANASEITILSSGGKENNIIKSDVLPDFVDLASGRLLYNEGRTLNIANLSGTVLAKYAGSRDVKKAYIIDANNIFIVYASSIEFLNLKGE